MAIHVLEEKSFFGASAPIGDGQRLVLLPGPRPVSPGDTVFLRDSEGNMTWVADVQLVSSLAHPGAWVGHNEEIQPYIIVGLLARIHAGTLPVGRGHLVAHWVTLNSRTIPTILPWQEEGTLVYHHTLRLVEGVLTPQELDLAQKCGCVVNHRSGHWIIPMGDARKRLLTQVRGVPLVCALCGAPIASIEEATVDHRIPSSQGGPDVLINLQLAHKPCNEFKGNALPEQYPPFFVAPRAPSAQSSGWRSRKYGGKRPGPHHLPVYGPALGPVNGTSGANWAVLGTNGGIGIPGTVNGNNVASANDGLGNVGLEAAVSVNGQATAVSAQSPVAPSQSVTAAGQLQGISNGTTQVAGNGGPRQVGPVMAPISSVGPVKPVATGAPAAASEKQDTDKAFEKRTSVKTSEKAPAQNGPEAQAKGAQRPAEKGKRSRGKGSRAKKDTLKDAAAKDSATAAPATVVPPAAEGAVDATIGSEISPEILVESDVKELLGPDLFIQPISAELTELSASEQDHSEGENPTSELSPEDEIAVPNVAASSPAGAGTSGAAQGGPVDPGKEVSEEWLAAVQSSRWSEFVKLSTTREWAARTATLRTMGPIRRKQADVAMKQGLVLAEHTGPKGRFALVRWMDQVLLIEEKGTRHYCYQVRMLDCLAPSVYAWYLSHFGRTTPLAVAMALIPIWQSGTADADGKIIARKGKENLYLQVRDDSMVGCGWVDGDSAVA